MPTATVTVQGKERPVVGKKRGRIKSDTGMIFQALPEILAKIEIGSTYEIAYKDETFGEAKYRVVEAVYPHNGAPGPIQPQPQSTPARSQAPLPTPDYKDEEIGCYAILKCFKPMEGGDAEAVFHNMKMAALALRKFKAWQRSAGSDMDDDIPY